MRVRTKTKLPTGRGAGANSQVNSQGGYGNRHAPRRSWFAVRTLLRTKRLMRARARDRLQGLAPHFALCTPQCELPTSRVTIHRNAREAERIVSTQVSTKLKLRVGRASSRGRGKSHKVSIRFCAASSHVSCQAQRAPARMRHGLQGRGAKFPRCFSRWYECEYAPKR